MKEANVVEAQVVEPKPEQTQAVAIRERGGAVGILRPADSLDHIAEAFREYQRVCETILDASDYQAYEGKPRKKKSAWRKLATAFNVSTAVVKEEVERSGRGQILSASFTVRAYVGPKDNPHRQFEAVGYCDISEKCCASARGVKCHKAGWKGHYCCSHDCDGRKHWSHPDHDVRSTAQTRASNRAIADLIGCGEVSAEELTDDSQAPGHPPPGQRRGQAPKRATEAPAGPPKKKEQHYATAESRKKMMDVLQQSNFDLKKEVLPYFIDAAILMPNEGLEDLPLRWVPVTLGQMSRLKSAILTYQKDNKAVKPYDPNPELDPPKSAKQSQAGSSPAKSEPPKRAEDWFFNVIITVPRKGMKKNEYDKHPDTIGSLYDAAHADGDEEAAKRLFGLAHKWDAAPHEYNGKMYPPTKADKLCREALDAFLEWHEKQPKEEAERQVAREEDHRQAEEYGDVPF